MRASACLIRFVCNNNSNQHKLCFCQCLHKVSAQLCVCECECVLTGPFCRASPTPSFSFPCLLLTNTLTRYDHKKLTRKVAAVATVVFVAVVDCCMSARATHLTAASAVAAAGVVGVSLSLSLS